MRKQHKTYLLLALVLTVWGIIGFRVVRAINPATDETEDVAEVKKFKPVEIKKRKEFSIVADYRDPFLGTFEKPKPKSVKVVTPNLKKETPKKNIQYTGFVSTGEKNGTLYFVTIDGNQQMMEVNCSYNEVKLLQGTETYIRVRYNGITDKILLTQ